MKINTSHYFPFTDLENILAVMSLIDLNNFDVQAGIILQITPKQ